MASEPVRLISPINQYLGINAHLHSHFLHDEPQGWEEFHSDHITDLTRAMNEHLMAMGYIARKERSLQIRYFDDSVHQPISDVLIGHLPSQAQVTPQHFGGLEAAYALNVPASALLEMPDTEIKRPSAIKIYEREPDDDEGRGKPVAWIELLSPSNKSGAGYVDYVAKREALLGNRLVFVELDYLHGISTTLEKIPDYRPQGRDQQPDPDAYPYHLWLIDPRLSPDDAQSGAIAAFAVDQPIPALTIPLNHGDRFTFAFNDVYHRTFNAQPGYSLVVDYRKPPESVERDYNRRDQIAIAARMLTVQNRARDGLSLSDAPEAVDADVLRELQDKPDWTRM